MGWLGAEHGHSVARVGAQAGDEAGVDVQHAQVCARADAYLRERTVSAGAGIVRRETIWKCVHSDVDLLRLIQILLQL